MPTSKGVRAPFFVSVHSPRSRADALLGQAVRALEAGFFADALAAAEGLARQYPGAAAPATLRAKILQTCGSPLAPSAWDAAWACDPENPTLQDAMLQAWVQARSARRVAGLGAAFLPQRCREGSHESLLKILRDCGLMRVGACWRDGNRIAAMCFDLAAEVREHSRATLVIANESAERLIDAPCSGTLFHIEVPRPDGAWSVAFARTSAQEPEQILQGSPVVFPSPVEHGAKPGPVPRSERTGRTIDIVIPVYKDRAGVQACIKSVLASLPQNKTKARVIVVDDASPDATISAWLDGLANSGWITLLRNRFNLGFIEAVNRGLRASDANDALLLNADTEVAGDWLDRMAAALDSAADIASVMPWSNNGEIGSLLTGSAAKAAPEAERLHQIDATAAKLRVTGRTDDMVIPTCCGFAMLIKRDALRELGLLDGVSLARGYLEEVDWCLRARAAGWRHLLAAGVFIAHKGSSSFRAEKHLRVRQNRAIVAARYPTYYGEYARFLELDPLAPMRIAIMDALPSGGALWPRSAPHSPTSAPREFASALPSSCRRVAVWNKRGSPTSSARLLALARHLSAVPGQPLRLLVFGNAAEALRHTGVIDVVPSGGNSNAQLVNDIDLLRLTGCTEQLSSGFESIPAGIPHVPLDEAFDAHAWIACRVPQTRGAGAR